MLTCSRCKKWRLLAGQCTVCASIERLRAAAGSDRLPATLEAEAKVTKVLDSAYYSIARLFPESDEEEPTKGGAPPKRVVEERSTKGERSPKESSKEKRKKAEDPGEELGSKRVSEKEEQKKVAEVTKSEGSKTLPKKKEEEESRRARSRTPQRQKEKDKKDREKKDSKSRSVSGSRTRRKKREDHSPRARDSRGVPESVRPSSGIQREPFLRPRPSQREPRSPRTPDHPPPRTDLIPPAAGRDKLPGRGWRGPVPYSDHPRWSEGTNKGVTKRAKQELFDRRNTRGRW